MFFYFFENVRKSICYIFFFFYNLMYFMLFFVLQEKNSFVFLNLYKLRFQLVYIVFLNFFMDDIGVNKLKKWKFFYCIQL